MQIETRCLLPSPESLRNIHLVPSCLPDPYTYVEEVFPGVKIRAADLGTDWGLTDWDENGHPTIYYAYDLGDVQRRCVLLHEIRHVHRGPPCVSLCDIDEADCREETARWLLPDIRELGDLMAHLPVEVAAASLGILPAIIHDRVDNLTADELVVYGESFKPEPHGVNAACTMFYASPRRDRRERRHPCRRVTA